MEINKLSIAIMIPARAGSKRVVNKNLRLLSGKPLISYAIEAASALDYPVYVNSDCDDILKLSENYNVKQYKRPAELAGDDSTNDEFMLDFMKNTDYDYVVQLLPTSPFVTSEEIAEFILKMTITGTSTLVSVKEEKIGCVYKNKPLNFSKELMNPPSQEMEPILVYATALMGWHTESFISNMKELNCAYHGGNRKTEYFTLKGFSTVDIDNEEDFRLAETIAQFIPFEDTYKPFYYKPSHIDFVVPSVMKDDGVKGRSGGHENQPVTNVLELMENTSKDVSWYKTLVNTENNSCTVVNQMPNEGNRLHYHAKWNEWWYIIRGQWKFDIEDKSYNVKVGDLVFIEKGKKHKITAIGDTMASRLAVSRYDVEHIYEK